MNLALRALGWAIRFFWIITLAFAITCVYSATQINVELGEPVPLRRETGPGAALPIVLNNRGYYRIANLNITTTIRDDENQSLSETTSQVAVIHPQHAMTILHNIALDVNTMLSHPQYLFNDSELQVDGLIHLNYADLIPLDVRASLELPWGAPLSSFAAGPPNTSTYDFISWRVTVPISFQNHSLYLNVTGTVRVEIFNARNELLGEDTLLVDVPSGAAYNGEAEMLVPATRVTPTGEVHVYFEIDAFHYGPVVVSYG